MDSSFLPKFIKPYPSHFEYELKLLKTAIYNYLENTLLINPRKDQWLIDGIQMFFLMNYIDENINEVMRKYKIKCKEVLI